MNKPGLTTSTLLVASVVLASADLARAAYSTEWRDGCPAGDVEQNPDVTYDRPDAAPSYAGTEPRLLGPAPQLDSALIPTRVLIDGGFAHFASGGDAGPARLLGGLVQLHLNVGPQGSASAPPTVGGFTLTIPYLKILPGDFGPSGPTPDPGELGNMVLAGSVQHYWLTSILSGPSNDDGAGTVAGLRNALSGQVTVGFRPWASDPSEPTVGFRPWASDPSEPQEVVPLLQRSAFDSVYFAPHVAIGGAFEFRSEGVGCYAPFIHVRLSLVGTQDVGEQHLMLFFPETIAAGLAPTANSTVMLQYGLLFAGHTGPANDSLLPSSVVHRLRFGLDFTWKAGVSAGGSFDVFLGNALYDGTAAEAHVSWNFGFGPPLTPSKAHKDLYP